MSHARAVLAGTAWVFLCAGAAPARAELIAWSYSWSRSPVEVHSSNHNGAGYITLSDGGASSVTGNSYLVAANLQSHSTATPADPDVFTKAPYSLTLNLTDQDSQKSGAVTFGGQFDGTLTATSSLVQNTFVGQTTQQLVLGDHLFTVTIGPFTPPGPPGSVNSGGIAARAEVTVSTIFHLPEPGSAVLALVGAGGLTLLGRRRRRVRAGRGGLPPGRSS